MATYLILATLLRGSGLVQISAISVLNSPTLGHKSNKNPLIACNMRGRGFCTSRPMTTNPMLGKRPIFPWHCLELKPDDVVMVQLEIAVAGRPIRRWRSGGEAPDCRVDVGTRCKCSAGGACQRSERQPGAQVESRTGEGRTGRARCGINSVAAGCGGQRAAADYRCARRRKKPAHTAVNDTFPRQVSIAGGRAIGWLESEIQGWIAERVAKRRQPGAAEPARE